MNQLWQQYSNNKIKYAEWIYLALVFGLLVFCVCVSVQSEQIEFERISNGNYIELYHYLYNQLNVWEWHYFFFLLHDSSELWLRTFDSNLVLTRNSSNRNYKWLLLLVMSHGHGTHRAMTRHMTLHSFWAVKCARNLHLPTLVWLWYVAGWRIAIILICGAHHSPRTMPNKSNWKTNWTFMLRPTECSYRRIGHTTNETKTCYCCSFCHFGPNNKCI